MNLQALGLTALNVEAGCVAQGTSALLRVRSTVCACVYMYTHIYIYICICICICIYIYIYIYIYMRTYIVGVVEFKALL